MEGTALTLSHQFRPFTRPEFWNGFPSVKTEEVFFIRKCVGHWTHAVLYQGPRDQVWHSKQKQGASQLCGETTGPGHQEVFRDDSTIGHLEQEDVPIHGNSSLHGRAENPVSEGTRLKIHRTTGEPVPGFLDKPQMGLYYATGGHKPGIFKTQYYFKKIFDSKTRGIQVMHLRSYDITLDGNIFLIFIYLGKS